MPTPRKIRPMWWLSIVAAGWLSSCTPPMVERIVPDEAAGDQSQEVQVHVAFVNDGQADFSPTENYSLLIDGGVAIGSGIRLAGPLRFVDNSYVNGFPIPNHLEGDLIIDPNPAGGAREMAVANSSGISESLPFFVQCAGCPPPPGIDSVGPALVKGTTATIRLRGNHFRDPNDPSLLPFVALQTGSGLSVNQSAAVLSTDSQGDVLDVPITADSDASSGFHQLRVVTAGGPSNKGFVSVQPPEPAPLIVTDASVVGGGCIKEGQVELVITGENFDVRVLSQINVRIFKGSASIVEVLTRSFTVDDSHTIHASLGRVVFQIGTGPADGFEIDLITIRGRQSILHKDCNFGAITTPTPSPTPTPGTSATPTPRPTATPSSTPTPTSTPTPSVPPNPQISFITPDHITKGADVFVRCEGTNFTTNGQSSGRIIVTDPPPLTTLATVEANPRQIAVALLNVPTNVTGPITVQVQDVTTGQKSNPMLLQLDDPPAPTGVSYIKKLVSTSGGDFVLHRNFTSTGKADTGSYNLADSTGWKTDWNLTAPGVTFTSTVYNNSTGVMSFQVQADGTAPFSGDVGTNVRRNTAGKGDGNPVAFSIMP